MPMVIKRDETGKDPKAKKAAASTAAPAAKSPKPAKGSTKPASGSAKAKGKGGKGEANETPKLIIAGVVTFLALGFLVWYMFMSGGSKPTTPDGTDTKPTAGATAGTNANGGGAAGAGKGGGISTDDPVPSGASSRKLNKGSEGGGGEGIE
jgi:hypothetical protein